MTKPIDYCRIVDGGVSFRAVGRFGHEYRTWDDGFGRLWLYRSADHDIAIVRADTWEDAYSAVVDECLGDAQLEPEDIEQLERGEIPEGIGIRGSVPSNSDIGTTIYAAVSLNGEFLEPLSLALARELEITLTAVED